MNTNKLIEDVFKEYNISEPHQTYAQIIQKIVDEIQKERLEDFIRFIFENNPIKATTLMLLFAGKHLAETNAEAIDINQHSVLNGKKFKINAVFKIEEI